MTNCQKQLPLLEGQVGEFLEPTFNSKPLQGMDNVAVLIISRVCLKNNKKKRESGLRILVFE